MRAIDHHQAQADFRVLALEGGEQVRDEVLAARLDGELQLALQRALHVGKLHVETFQAPENIPTGLL